MIHHYIEAGQDYIAIDAQNRAVGVLKPLTNELHRQRGKHVETCVMSLDEVNSLLDENKELTTMNHYLRKEIKLERATKSMRFFKIAEKVNS